MNILRPLSPHLPIYKPQLTSTFPISHRISGAFLATIVLFFYLLCLKIGLICFTYDNFYQFFFYSSKFILIPVEITALALSYHLYNGVRLLFISFFIKIRLFIKRHSPPLFSMWTHLREIPFRRDLFSKWLPFILSKILPGLAIDLLFFFFPLYLEKRYFQKSTNIYSRFINLLDPKPLVNIVPRDAVKTREELQRKSPDFLYWDLQWKTKEATCFELSKLLEKNGINFPGNISVGLLDPFFRNLGNPNSDFQFDLRVYQDLVSWQDQSQFYKEFLMFIKQHKLIFIYDKFKGGKLGAG